MNVMWSVTHLFFAEGLREEDRVGTGIERPLESTSASLFERGTPFTENRHTNSMMHNCIHFPKLYTLYFQTHHHPSSQRGWDRHLKEEQNTIKSHLLSLFIYDLFGFF